LLIGIIIFTSCTADKRTSKGITNSFIYKNNLTVVIDIRLEHEDEQLWHKNKNKPIN